MPAFKEIKKRINAVKNIRKTTSAMKMVSSAKLRKAENMIANMLPYSEALQRIMASTLTDGGDADSVFGDGRPVKNVAVIAFSSDSSLCGAFNANVFRELQRRLDGYRQSLPDEQIVVYTVGKKIYDSARRAAIRIARNFAHLAGKPDYDVVADMAQSLITQFETRKIDRVELIYHHYKSAGSQKLVCETLLPVKFPQQEPAKSAGGGKKTSRHDYLFEPSRSELLRTLIPKSVILQIYTALLDSNASEHAARMIAMQTATDNADDLVNLLTIAYNKSRQQAITNEILDLIGGNDRNK